jgi:hypothetical protein
MRRSDRNIVEKKRRHTIKNTIISTTDKVIKFVGQTFCGANHDYTMLKSELPPEKQWFTAVEVFVDLGYQGIKTDYKGEKIQIPNKKPKKSKANPNTQLTDEQKRENHMLATIRIMVENAICGMKRYNVLNHRYRNRRTNFSDDIIGICAGLWNLMITNST